MSLTAVRPTLTSSMEMLATTRLYYRSTYVFLSRADRNRPAMAAVLAAFAVPRVDPPGRGE